jgi:hypothetical protein
MRETPVRSGHPHEEKKKIHERKRLRMSGTELVCFLKIRLLCCTLQNAGHDEPSTIDRACRGVCRLPHKALLRNKDGPLPASVARITPSPKTRSQRRYGEKEKKHNMSR